MSRLKTTMFLMWLFIVSISGVASLDQYFAIEPEDSSAVVDTLTSLPCKIANLAGQTQWTKDDFALGTNRNLSAHGYKRYWMTGTDEAGEFNLQINPVTLEDDGEFECQVSTGRHGEPAIRSKTVTLTVLVPPDRPRILQGDLVYGTEGVPQELVCVSAGGKPPAELTWTDGSGNPIVKNITTTIEEMANEPKRFTTKSTLKITPRMEQHNTSIRCHAHNKGSENKKLHTKTTMNVKFAPKIELVIAGPHKKLVEGMSVQFLCKTKANPADVVYKWFVKDQLVMDEVSSELWLTTISRNLHNSYVRCEAQNSEGKAEAQYRLNILYKPMFKNKPKSLEAELGNNVKLSCDVDSNPPATVEWTNVQTKKVVSTSSNLTLYNIGPKNSGVYRCKTTTPGFGELQAEVSVILRTAPVILSSTTQSGYLFMTATLECYAKSVPPPENLKWTFKGNIIGTALDKSRFAVEEEMTEDGLKSTLFVKNAIDDQFGDYNCTVSNYYGSNSMTITLTKKYDLMMLVAVVCAGTGIIMIVICLVVARIASHRQMKRILRKSDLGGAESDCTDNKQNAAAIRDSDVSSNVSDIKVETGTGSSLSNYRYNGDNDSTTGGPDSTTAAADGDNHHRSASPRSEHGLPLAGPVQFDHSRLAPGPPDNRPISMIHHPLAENDYANPMNYVVYNNNNNMTDRPVSSSNGYIAADRLYDLNPVPQSSLMTTSLGGPQVSLANAIPAAARKSGGDPATALQYSAAYRNPYLRQSSSAQWLGHNQRQPYDSRPDPPPYGALRTARNSTGAAAAAAVPSATGPNYHIGVAKRQTLATHV